MGMSGEGEQKVTPWEAHAAEGEAKIDFDKLIRELLCRVCVVGVCDEYRSVWESENR